MAQWYWRCRGRGDPRGLDPAPGHLARRRHSSAARTSAPRTSQYSGPSPPDPGSSSPCRAGASARRCVPPSRLRLRLAEAEVAESEAAAWNAASLGVSRSLGYEPNGVTRMPGAANWRKSKKSGSPQNPSSAPTGPSRWKATKPPPISWGSSCPVVGSATRRPSPALRHDASARSIGRWATSAPAASAMRAYAKQLAAGRVRPSPWRPTARGGPRAFS